MAKIKKSIALILTLALVITLLPYSSFDSFAAKKTKISKKKITLVVGQKKKLKIKNKPKGVKVKWKSKNKKIAKVSKKGKVKALRVGKTKIIAKVGKKKYKCTVIVKARSGKGKQKPTTRAPATQQPTAAPIVTTTKNDVTVEPTAAPTQAPTQVSTAAPTQAPTTQAPVTTTTKVQTTKAPTTKAPVTTTTKAPTTKAPVTTTTKAATTKAPTTVAPITTTASTVQPIKPVGLVVSCTGDNKINVVWGQDAQMIALGQLYNVYINGVLKEAGVICKSHDYDNIPAGSCTVKITATLNGIESEGIETTITVTGSGDVTQAPTQAPTTKAPTTKAQTTAAPTTTVPATAAPTVAPTTKNQNPTTQMQFDVDDSLQVPFGIVLSNPDPGIINVVWGAGEPNCYNVYVDGVRKKTKVPASNQRIPVQTEGRHVVAIATVSKDNKESRRAEEVIIVNGTAPEEVETTALPPEQMPEIDESIQKQDGKMILQLNNKTNGQYRDDQIYWIIIGRNPSTHRIAYLTADGNLVEASASDNDGTIGGRNYSQKIVHSLAEKKAVQLPAIESGRMYLSYGEPVYITFNGEGQNIGYAGPDVNNPGDANYHTLFEYLEFTTESINNTITFHGNVTRVDFFSFPMIARLTDEYGSYDRCVGDLKSRSETFSLFNNTVSAPFKTLITDERIMSPAKLTFGEGKQYGNYFDDYINRFWSKYASQDLTFSSETGTFTGRVSGDRIIFNNQYYIDKPTTQDVLEGRGAFNRKSPENQNDEAGNVELAIEAQLCAAFTRGVALNPENWSKPETYYQSGEICNEYAAFFHPNSVSNRAYGFCYDDVFDQSTLVECGNAERFTIDLKW